MDIIDVKNVDLNLGKTQIMSLIGVQVFCLHKLIYFYGYITAEYMWFMY